MGMISNFFRFWFLKACIWQMQLEHDIGDATGMNWRYLSGLRGAIKDMDRELRMMELNA